MSRCCEIYPSTGARPAEDAATIDPHASVIRDMTLLFSLVAAIVLVVITAAAL